MVVTVIFGGMRGVGAVVLYTKSWLGESYANALTSSSSL